MNRHRETHARRHFLQSRPLHKARCHRPGFDSLENRLLLDAGGFSRPPPAALVAGQLAADSVPIVKKHGDSSAHLATASAVTRERLVITQPPGTPHLFGFVFNGIPFGLTVAAENGRGRVLPRFHGRMTISLAASPGGATLGGKLTVKAKDGAAIFTNLTLSQPGNGYVLRVSGAGLAVKTAPFDVQANVIVYPV